jgi:molybdopterin-guanine dinucleotide biosynthesis protein A
MCIKKSTVVLVLAGGTADEFQTGNFPKYKALLPVCGQPVTNYVIRALEQSNVEKIFIIQDENANLQATLTASSKCLFFRKDRSQNTLCLSILFGLEKMAEYYGRSQFNQKSIMFVPCDIPLATKENFNSLIENAAGNNADVTITIIAEKLIKKRFPKKRFRSLYLVDYKDRYTIQMVGFMNGEFIQYEPSGESERAKISFRGVDEERLIKIRETLDNVRDHRFHNYRLPRFTEKFAVRWLINKAYMIYFFKFIFNLIFNRLTMAKIIEYIYGACQATIAIIVSEELELSADIDRPEDFPIVLGIPWENEIGYTAFSSNLTEERKHSSKWFLIQDRVINRTKRAEKNPWETTGTIDNSDL